MPFSFVAKKEDILKIITDEREKARIVAQTEIDSLDVLDRLKIDCGVDIPSTMEAFNACECNGINNKLLWNSIAPDLYYIYICQVMTLAILAHEEIKRLNNQVCFMYKKALGQALTKEEEEEYIPFGMQDLNEMLRYIYVWSVGNSLREREKYTTDYEDFNNIFDASNTMKHIQIKNHAKYMWQVRKLYSKQASAYKEWLDNTFNQHLNILVENIQTLNRILNYEPLHRFDVNDGSREPLGSPEDDDYYHNFCEGIEQDYLATAVKRRIEIRPWERER